VDVDGLVPCGVEAAGFEVLEEEAVDAGDRKRSSPSGYQADARATPTRAVDPRITPAG